MRILVLGGTRFIGPPVVRRLCARGHSVTIFHRGKSEPDLPPEVNHLHGDLRNLAEFRDVFLQAGCEVVIHMVPFGEEDSRRVMTLFRGLARRAVAISSIDVYKNYGLLTGIESGTPDQELMTEESPLRSVLYPYRTQAPGPESPNYHYEKILAEREFLSDPELPGSVVRLPMVYGPGDYQHRLFPYLKRMDDGRPFLLLPETVRTWRSSRGFVEDIAEAIVRVALDARAAGRVYNAADPEPYTEYVWVQRIAEAAGWRGEIRLLPPNQLPAHLQEKADFRAHLAVDTTRIRTELDFEEELPENETLERTIAWERANPPASGSPTEADYAAEDAV